VQHIPHLAISGINADNVASLAQAGCKGIAVSSVVCASDDPAKACRDLLHTLTSHAPPTT